MPDFSRLARPIAFLAAVWIAMLLAGASAIDRALITSAHVGDGPWLGPVLFITRLGDWEVLSALPFFAAAWLILKRRKRLALLFLAAVFSGRLLIILQKALLGRLRPDAFEYLVDVESFAFPSGHAGNSMIVYVLLALVLCAPQWRRRAVLAAVLLSVLIGISRVLLGVHWPSDVVGGWAFGIAWVILAARILEQYRRGGEQIAAGP